MTHRIPAALALVIVTAAAVPANAERAVRNATIELVESTKDGSKTVSFTVALVDDGATSTVQSRMNSGFYQVKVRRDTHVKGKGSSPMLSVELERHDDKGPKSISMQATTTAAIGKRAVLLRVDRGDGTKYEVAATVR